MDLDWPNHALCPIPLWLRVLYMFRDHWLASETLSLAIEQSETAGARPQAPDLGLVMQVL